MRKFFLAFLLMIEVFLLLRWQSAALVTAVTPGGILALEFCDNIPELNSILAAWDVSTARNSVLIDFLFIAAFALVFYFGSRHVNHKWNTRFTRMMVVFSFVPPKLDIAENSLMLITLSGVKNTTLLQFTKYIAVIKFAAAAAIVLYLLVSLFLIYGYKKKTIRLPE